MPTDDSQHFENTNIYSYQNNKKDSALHIMVT